jgi:3-oxoacyl-[acyl-carrier-protein] synthase II
MSPSRPRPKKRRVVVTGIGAVTPLGVTFGDSWNGLVEGVVTCAPVRRFDATRFPTKIGYEVQGFRLREELVTERERFFLNDAARYGVNAAAEAMAQAGLALGGAGLDGDRVGVCLGVGMCSPDFKWYEGTFIPQALDQALLAEHVRFFPDQLGAVAARMLGARAGVTTIHTACASSGQSLGEAFEQIAYGDADVVLTGGADSMIHPFYFAGFSLLGALSKRNGDPKTASRPFDKDRDGFVLGEGACMLVFEEEGHAKARGATILAEICGYGITESAYRITDLHPEGHGPIEAMQMALADAGLPPEAVGYVNAHGTSTSLNDRIEALAVSKVFPKERCKTRVSSTKSMTGHMISAAGAIELAICVQALARQVLPPSVNLITKDADVLAELTPRETTAASFDYALSNSVGFGGSNTALIAGRIKP